MKEAIHRGDITLHEGRPSELGPNFYVINDQYPWLEIDLFWLRFRVRV